MGSGGHVPSTSISRGRSPTNGAHLTVVKDAAVALPADLTVLLAEVAGRLGDLAVREPLVALGRPAPAGPALTLSPAQPAWSRK